MKIGLNTTFNIFQKVHFESSTGFECDKVAAAVGSAFWVPPSKMIDYVSLVMDNIFFAYVTLKISYFVGHITMKVLVHLGTKLVNI